MERKQSVEAEVWARLQGPDPAPGAEGRPVRGLVVLAEMKTVQRFSAELLEAVRANGHGALLERCDYVSECSRYLVPVPAPGERDARAFDRARAEVRVPKGYWRMIAYAVPGGSEGHYVHVGVLLQSERAGEPASYVDLVLAKTFEGREEAHALAGAFSEALEW